MALNATNGVISGTPATAGASTFTIRVEDSSTVKKAAEKSFTIDIAEATAIQIANTSLPDGTVSVAYSVELKALGSTGALLWTVSAGALPPGFTLVAATGILSGSPTTAGDYNFTVNVVDGATKTDSQPLTIHIAPTVTP